MELDELTGTIIGAAIKIRQTSEAEVPLENGIQRIVNNDIPLGLGEARIPQSGIDPL